jgi:hypothetical protein
VYVAITAPTQPRCKSLRREKKQCTKELPKTLCKTLRTFKEKIAVLRGGSERKSKQKFDQNYCYGNNQKKNFKKKKKLPKKSWKQTTKQTLYLQHAETKRTTTTDFRKLRGRKCDDGRLRKRTKRKKSKTAEGMNLYINNKCRSDRHDRHA